MGNKVVLLAVVYCILSISSKLILFYSHLYDSFAGRLIPLAMLGLLLPFSLLLSYLKRKENNGIISGKEVVKYSLTMVTIIAVVMAVFDFAFFQLELKSYAAEIFKNTDYKLLLAEKLKHDPKANMLDIVRQQMAYENSFKTFSVSRAVFPIFAFGLFSSFISGVFMKRS